MESNTIEQVKKMYSKDSIEYLRYHFFMKEGLYYDLFLESHDLRNLLEEAKENVFDKVFIDQPNSWSEWEVVVPFKQKQFQFESHMKQLYKSHAMLTSILEATRDERYNDVHIKGHREEIANFVKEINKNYNTINKGFKIFNERVDSYIDVILEGPDDIEVCGFKKLKESKNR